jgi:hypothetical protein
MKMFQRFFAGAACVAFCLFAGARITHAATPTPSLSPSPVATQSALQSPNPATASAATVTPVQPVDITQTTEVTKSNLSTYLDQTAGGKLAPWNFVQHGLRNAVDRGIPANILVLLLLFPITATIISAFRHIIGLRGFGVYTPAVLAVAFISLGIVKGLFLFFVVFIMVMIGRPLVNWARLQYLPRTALLLWFVSSTMFVLFVLSPYLPIPDLATVGIFPLLMLILLSEHFLEAQLLGNLGKAVQLTIETLFLSISSALFMRTFEVQKFVIIYPEITMLAVLIVNIVVGKYTGLRISEFFRFKPIIDPEE